MKYTPLELAAMPLLTYERTRADAIDAKKDYEQEHPGSKCVVWNATGTRARGKTYDKPWQVRIVPQGQK